MDRNALMIALGAFPRKVPLRPTILETIDCGSYMRQKLEYFTEEDEAVRAFLCIPTRRSTKTPAVFCHHQHDWNFAIGKSEVVGLAGNPDQAYAAELAQRGYITIAPDAIGFEERNRTGGSFETAYFEMATRLVTGRTLLAKILHDASVCIDYLESRDEVDANRIGFLGHSYGGRVALWLPAFDTRVKASVSHCGCIGYRHSLARDAGIQMEFCIPGIMTLGDVSDVVRLAAPTPLYISAADNDTWSRGAQQLYDAARPLYPGETLKLKIWPGGHAFTQPMRQAAYEFLDRFLQNPQSS